MPRTQQEKTSVDKGKYNSPNASAGQPIIKKEIHMRTLCIEQLQKIDQLLKNDSISQIQHDKLQEAIMDKF